MVDQNTGFRTSRPAMMAQTRATSMVDQAYQPSSLSVGPGALSNRMSAGSNAVSQSFRQPPTSSASNRLLDQPSLPRTFDLKSVRMEDKDACQLCDAAFTRKLKVVNRNSQKNCKRCGRAVCEACSDQRRQLSVADDTLHRICDKCDTEMDNFKLKRNHEEVLAAQKKKIEMLNHQLVQLEEDKAKLESDCKEELRLLQVEVRNQYAKRDDLTAKLAKLKTQIGEQNSSRNYLHKQICDLENAIADLEVEQKRLMTKQNLIQTQTIELEHQLRAKTMQNEKERDRLEALKQKVGK